jgi:multicomponent Na+:H+ antiporter subunit D
MLLLLPLLIPLAAALLSAMLPARGYVRQGVGLASALAQVLAAGALLSALPAGGRFSLVLGDWPLPYGIELAADTLSAALILVSALLGLAVMLYSIGRDDAESATQNATATPLMLGLLASVAAVFLAADLFNLYVWFELMLIATLGLLVGSGDPRRSEAAFKYLVLNLLGTLLVLVAVALIYAASGQLNFTALRVAGQWPEVAAGLRPYLGLLLLALLLKAGALPLFAWLPASYPALPPPALALVGGLLTKVATYVLLRLAGQVFAVPDLWLEALGWLALLTMLAGVMGAAYHWDVRRILALHIVSQVGYLLLGIALASPAAAAGTAYFAVHNILVKANLFLIAGLMFASAGHYDLRRIGGLYAARPLLAALFLLSAFSLVGVPPSTGFWGKFMLLREAFEQERYVWGGGALAVGLLTLYSMSKIWLEGFWKAHPDATASAGVIPVPGYAAVLLLTGLILVMGLYPEPFIHLAQVATSGFWQQGSGT